MIFSLKYSKITSQDVIFGAVDRMSTGSFLVACTLNKHHCKHTDYICLQKACEQVKVNRKYCRNTDL